MVKCYIKADITDAFDDSPAARVAIASDPNTRPATLIRLAGDELDEVTRAVADNPNAPVEALDILRHSPDFLTRGAVARNTNTPSEFLADLALYDDDFTVRQLVVRNPNTSKDTLCSLASDFSSIVRAEVGSNPDTPIHILHRLASDCDVVRIHVAGNPSIPLELFEQLCNDPSASVKAALADNPSVPSPEFRKYIEDQLLKNTEINIRFVFACNWERVESLEDYILSGCENILENLGIPYILGRLDRLTDTYCWLLLECDWIPDDSERQRVKQELVQYLSGLNYIVTDVSFKIAPLE